MSVLTGRTTFSVLKNVSRSRHRGCRILRGLATSADSPPVTATNRAEVTLKRFWKTVGLEEKNDGFVVTLDKRPLKTPSGNTLVVPRRKRLAATLVANEWENQDKVLKAHALPMTSLVSRAIDGLRKETSRDEVAESLLSYLDTDTICFHADEPSTLVKLQSLRWDPIIQWVREDFAVEIDVHKTILGSGQPKETQKRIMEILNTLDEFELAALERVTYSTKSLLIALALVKGRIDVEEAARAAHVEVNSQIERWGEVEDTHDVDHRDIRRQLGSATCLLHSS